MISIEVLRACAVEFLRYQRDCKMVCLERSPFLIEHKRRNGQVSVEQDPCNPDVVGVTEARRVVEIEIKRTFSDFKKNREKTSMFRRQFLNIMPSQFYFLVPPNLVAKVEPLLEQKEGLLTTMTHHRSAYTNMPVLRIVKDASVMRDSRRLTLREMVRMVMHQTGTLSSALVKVARVYDEDPVGIII